MSLSSRAILPCCPFDNNVNKAHDNGFLLHGSLVLPGRTNMVVLFIVDVAIRRQVDVGRFCAGRSTTSRVGRWKVLKSKRQFGFLRELFFFAVPGRASQYMGVHFFFK
jgi:hypothetical protein